MTEKQITAKVHARLMRRANVHADAQIAAKKKLREIRTTEVISILSKLPDGGAIVLWAWPHASL